MLEKSDFVSWANEAEHRCAGQRGVHFFVCPHVVEDLRALKIGLGHLVVLRSAVSPWETDREQMFDSAWLYLPLSLSNGQAEVAGLAIHVTVSSPTFRGSSGCQHTAMPGAVRLNIMHSSVSLLHTRHVRSSPVLANWPSSPGAKVTELTKSVWPFRTWRYHGKGMTLLRVSKKNPLDVFFIL